MVLEGVTDIVFDESSFGIWVYSTWREITSNHILSFYEGSVRVQDLMLFWRKETAPENMARVAFYVVAWYRGVEGAFRLDDPFLDDSLEPYLDSLRAAAGPFRAVTGVVVSITGAPPVVEVAIPTPAPVPLVRMPDVPATTAPVLWPLKFDVPTVPISWRPPTVDSNVTREAVESSSASRMVWFSNCLSLVLLGSSTALLGQEPHTVTMICCSSLHKLELSCA